MRGGEQVEKASGRERDPSALSLMVRSNFRVLPDPLLAAAIVTGLLFGALDNGIGRDALGIAAALLLGWQAWLGLPGRAFWRAITPAFALICAALGWAMLASTRAGALTPDLMRNDVIGVLGYAAILLLACALGYRQPRITGLTGWLLLFLSIDTAIGLLLLVFPDPGSLGLWQLDRYGRFFGTVNNANVAGALCDVAAVLALSRILERISSGHRLSILAPEIAALSLAIAGAVYSASRAGAVLGLVALAAIILLDRVRRGIGGGGRMAGGLIVMALILFVALTPIPVELLARSAKFGNGAFDRVMMWTHYGQIAGNSPWFGFGFGSFPTMNAHYPGDLFVAGRLWAVNSPHNIGLHCLLTAGWPYALLNLAAAMTAAIPIARASRLNRLGPDVHATLVAAMVLLGSSMVDLALEMPGGAALFLLLAGSAWGQALRATLPIDA